MICKRKIKAIEKPYYLQYAKNYTSQYGEDGIIEKIFQSIYSHEEIQTSKKFCIDVGAWDGKHWSNTYHLINEFKWGGILIEADKDRYEALSNLYKERPDVQCLNCIADCSGENILLNILYQKKAPKEPNFLCIDIDGADYHLWECLGDQFRSHVVCIEFNPTIPNDVYCVQPADIRIQKGSSLLALNELGQKLGYTLVACTTFNAFFVRNDLTSRLPYIPPNDLDLIYTPTMITEIFQTYDGELCYVGTKKLLWHDIALNPQKLQLLTKKNQKFPFSPYEVQVLSDLETSYNNILLWKRYLLKGTITFDVLAKHFSEFIKLLSIPTFQGVAEKRLNSLFLELLRRDNISSSLDEKNFAFLIDGILLMIDQMISFALNFLTTDVNQGICYLSKVFNFLELFSQRLSTYSELSRSSPPSPMNHPSSSHENNTNESTISSPQQTNNVLILLKFLEISIHFLRCYRLLEDCLSWNYWLRNYCKFNRFLLQLKETSLIEFKIEELENWKALKVIMEKEKKKISYASNFPRNMSSNSLDEENDLILGNNHVEPSKRLVDPNDKDEENTMNMNQDSMKFPGRIIRHHSYQMNSEEQYLSKGNEKKSSKEKKNQSSSSSSSSSFVATAFGYVYSFSKYALATTVVTTVALYYLRKK